jgi:hypothetical protein
MAHMRCMLDKQGYMDAQACTHENSVLSQVNVLKVVEDDKVYTGVFLLMYSLKQQLYDNTACEVCLPNVG